MQFDFDSEVDKTGISSLKWEYVLDENHRPTFTNHAHVEKGAERMLPMWVADMDFRVAPEIISALQKRIARGVFGYAYPSDAYFNAVIDWFQRRYDRLIEQEWILLTPGVVTALNFIVQTFTAPGDKILIQRPVYHPFTFCVENNGREVVSNRLVLQDGRYEMDFADLAEKTADPEVKMAILCSPHNPIGRVWSREELTRFGEICQENDVLVISDEIHCDLIYDGVEFVTYANISPEFAQNSIICTAASKTFNIAGLKTSNIIIPDPVKRAALQQTMAKNGVNGVNSLGLIATEAAYREGEAWLTAVMAYIQKNAAFMQAYLAEHLPMLRLIQPEGTYLAWLDCRALEMEPEERKKFMFEEAKLYLDEGEIFGPEGTGFERINLACHRNILEEALERLRKLLTK